MYKVKDREAFWCSRNSDSGSSQPSPANVKAVIEPFLKEKGIKMSKSIGNGNMSCVFEGKILSTNKSIIIKAIGIKSDCIHPLGFVLYDRICKKEESALKRLNAEGANVVKLIESMECPINYTTFMDRAHHDSIRIFIFEKLFTFSEGRGKGHIMAYNKVVKKWCKKYGVEVVAAVLGAFLIKEVKRLNQLGIWHRDLKTENMMLKIVSDDIFKAEFNLIDFGFSHIKNWDTYSNENDHIGLPGTSEQGGGTYKYYPHFDQTGFKFEDEYFAVGMVTADLLGYLKNNNNEVRGKIETSNLSEEMKKALFCLTEYRAEDRNPDLALRIFEDIIKKAKIIYTDKDKVSKHADVKEVKLTSKKEKHTLEDVEKAILKGNYEKAFSMSRQLEDTSVRCYRLKGIIDFLRYNNNGEALMQFRAIAYKDLWSAYFAAILAPNESERYRLLLRLYDRAENEEVIRPLVAWNLLETNPLEVPDSVLEDVKKDAAKVNPEKIKFKKLMELAIKAA